MDGRSLQMAHIRLRDIVPSGKIQRLREGEGGNSVSITRRHSHAGNAIWKGIEGRSLRNCTASTKRLGETMHFYPRIALPAACNAAGILGTIPISSLFVKELTASPGFKMIMVNMDGAATNKAALRMLRTELQRYEQLIVAPVLCSAHSMNNAVKWGLGTFPYGPYLRTAHCFESTARPDAIIHVDRMLDGVPGRLPTWRVTRSFLCNYCNVTESKLGGDRVQCARRL